MPSANQFQPVSATVSASPTDEVLVAKQAALTDHSHEVRASLQQLEPGLARDLLARYETPSPAVVRDVALAIADHESLTAALAAGGGLDLAGGQDSRADVTENLDLHADDPWIAQP